MFQQPGVLRVAPPYPQGHLPSMVFSPPPVERALRAAAAALPTVTVAPSTEVLSTEVLSLAQGAAGVRLQARIAGSAAGGTGQTMRAHDAIACGGGARGARSQWGAALDDLDFDEPLAGGRCAGE